MISWRENAPPDGCGKEAYPTPITKTSLASNGPSSCSRSLIWHIVPASEETLDATGTLQCETQREKPSNECGVSPIHQRNEPTVSWKDI